ncbi:MAG TPA: pyruvate kinase [Candidatus Deferrimicrobium sp.]|nr:pyruvate kinase [Candidatus Deferrimicrobium sp.]
MQNRTKIIATIGPVSSSEEVLYKLIKNGMNLARLNFSFGTAEEHKDRIIKMRKVSEELELPVAIIQDLQGPKLRIGKILDGSIDLIANNSVTIIDTPNVDKNTISITYPDFAKYVSKEMHLLLDDGLIELKIEEIDENKIHCKVLHGGHLVEGKGLNIPSAGLKIPAITDKDRNDLKFGLKNDIDFVALSFVQKKEDILELKDLISNANKDVQVIAKIEKPEAVDNITDIMQISDAIMVARGDLAIEVPLERVPTLQRRLIDLCHLYSKPVIIATMMLYTMEMNPRPTRAEVSDVANAVYEGTDVVMLSNETAVGKYPIEAVQTMVRIVSEAERTSPLLNQPRKYEIKSIYQIPSGVSHSVCELADVLHAKAIFTFTASGFTALAISKQRPKTPIIALTTTKEIQRRCNIYWGVKSIITENIDSTDKMFKISEKLALDESLAKTGEIIIITAGIPFGISGTTNLIKVHTIGESDQ